MSSTASHSRSRRLPEHLDKPLYRALVTLGLFDPLRMLSRSLFRFRTQRRALKGHGLVPEQSLQATYVAALRILRERSGEDVGDYLEFGVCHGSSMACMHDALTHLEMPHVRKFGFDSFEGLPPEADEQDGGFFSKGQFDSSIDFTRKLLTSRGIDWKKTFLIRGWFRDTLNPTTAAWYNIRKVGIVMIDCDIYSASKEALDFVGPLLADDAVLVFDDWNSGNLAGKNMGEAKAFFEFIEENPQFSFVQLKSMYENSAVFLLTRAARDRPAE